MELSDPVYARTPDGAYIAYQVLGDGPVDIAWQFDFYGNIDTVWESPTARAWLSGLASFSRLILHDRRATGLSSRNVTAPNLETRAADLRAVLDAAGSGRAVVGGWLESLAPGVLLAASHPERVRGLVWWNPNPRTLLAPDYPWGSTQQDMEEEIRGLEHWGTAEYGRAWAMELNAWLGIHPPAEEVRAIVKETRNTCTPDVAVELTRIWWESDIRGILPAVQVPTLLMANEGEGDSLQVAEHVASLMPMAEIGTFPGGEWPSRDRLAAYTDLRLEAIRRFIGLEPSRRGLDTVLCTVLFTDIVGSTERQAARGDRGWKELVEHHHSIVREGLSHWRGVENDTAGDGFYATFDGPARAVRCAMEIGQRVHELGIQIRAGVHTGECEVIDDKIGGIAVTIGARVLELAGPSEVLATQTVRDLVAGSGLTFEGRGKHQLKGVPGEWQLYAAARDSEYSE